MPRKVLNDPSIMGMTLEFALGDPEAIRKAVEEIDLDRLDDPAVIKARADVSLHVTPHDLDTLSEEFATVSNQEAIPLRPHLEVLFDDIDRGVLLVDNLWVAYVAVVPMRLVRDVTEQWIARMSQEYDDAEIVLTDAAVRAVEDLVTVCVRAKADGEPLVQLWFL